MKYSSFYFLMLAFIFSSCGFNDDITKKDSPTTGSIQFFFDEGLTLHINNQLNTFKTIYEYAVITSKSTNEKDCLEGLFNDSCKVIAITRPLTESELDKFNAKNIHIESSLVAKDAIAVIVSKSFADSTLSIERLQELLNGNDSSYVKNTHLSIVFDNQQSGSAYLLKNKLAPHHNFGKNCSAMTNSTDLIKNISENSRHIGICDYAWLSDKDDNTTKAFLKKIKILAISNHDNETAYMPDQSNIATGDYPLVKNIYIIRRSSDFSLAKGIQTFIAGEKGQLMFLKQGLPPNRQEERVIEVTMTPMK